MTFKLVPGQGHHLQNTIYLEFLQRQNPEVLLVYRRYKEESTRLFAGIGKGNGGKK